MTSYRDAVMKICHGLGLAEHSASGSNWAKSAGLEGSFLMEFAESCHSGSLRR
jgi:hypothetical protein